MRWIKAALPDGATMAPVSSEGDDDDDGREGHLRDDVAGSPDAAWGRGARCDPAREAGEVIEDGSRHRAIGSLHALGLAIVASVLVTGLLYAAL